MQFGKRGCQNESPLRCALFSASSNVASESDILPSLPCDKPRKNIEHSNKNPSRSSDASFIASFAATTAGSYSDWKKCRHARQATLHRIPGLWLSFLEVATTSSSSTFPSFSSP